MGWTQARAPYRKAAHAHAHATPRHAILRCTMPSHSSASIPSISLLACLACRATLTDGYSSPPEPSVPGYGVGNPWTRRCLRGGVLHLTRQVSMLTVQGSQEVANLGVGDSPALQWQKKQTANRHSPPPVCMSVASLWSPSTLSWPSPTAHSAPLPVQSSDPCSILLIKRSGLLGNVANCKV